MPDTLVPLVILCLLPAAPFTCSSPAPAVERHLFADTFCYFFSLRQNQLLPIFVLFQYLSIPLTSSIGLLNVVFWLFVLRAGLRWTPWRQELFLFIFVSLVFRCLAYSRQSINACVTVKHYNKSSFPLLQLKGIILCPINKKRKWYFLSANSPCLSQCIQSSFH